MWNAKACEVHCGMPKRLTANGNTKQALHGLEPDQDTYAAECKVMLFVDCQFTVSSYVVGCSKALTLPRFLVCQQVQTRAWHLRRKMVSYVLTTGTRYAKGSSSTPSKDGCTVT